MQAHGDDYLNGVLYFGQSGENVMIIANSSAAPYMRFKTANIDRMQLDALGRLDIGTISLTRLLHLYGIDRTLMIDGTGTTTIQKIEFGTGGIVRWY